MLRPIEPGDKELLARAFERLSEDSRYWRFSPMRELARVPIRCPNPLNSR